MLCNMRIMQYDRMHYEIVYCHGTVFVWSLSTGQRLLGPLQHDHWVVGGKFSPDGSLIATATWYRESVRIYDSQNGHLLVDVPIKVNSYLN